MPTTPLTAPFTALDLLDRGLARSSALTRAVDLDLVTDPAGDLVVDLGDAAAAADSGALLAGIREIATGLDRSHLGGLVDDLVVIASPQALAERMIAQKYELLGSAAGILGSTAGAVTACPDGIGWYRRFQRGTIVWNPRVGAHEVHGPIGDRWAAEGAERGPLGYPTTDQLAGKDAAQVGQVSHFENGSLYWYPRSRFDAVTGIEVNPAVTELVASASLSERVAPSAPSDGRPDVTATNLAPVNRAVVRPGSPVLAQPANGIGPGVPVVVRPPVVPPVVIPPIVRPPDGHLYEVKGAIRARYLALGGEGSILGYPTSDEKPTASGTGAFSTFQAGSIYWSPATGAHEVHGLIHALWAAGGFDQDPTLGYPLTDELVPDRRVGSRRPETWRKPVLDLPVDVVKLPQVAISGHVPPSVVNLPTHVDISALDDVTRTGLVSAGIVTHVGGVLGGSVGGVTTAADTPSPNRFGDFENGVAFWHRGATTAIRLTPWRRTGGSGPTMKAKDVVDAVTTRLQQVLGSGAAGLRQATFAGTSGYRNDGVATHNRAHRVDVSLSGGGLITVEAIVALDPVARTATLSLVSWTPRAGIDAAVSRTLHQRLDVVLWTPTTLLDLAEAGKPTGPLTALSSTSALLSVKTAAGGDVNVYLEPTTRLGDVLVDDVRADLADGVLTDVRDARTPVPIR
ncbi:MAG TPA: hypothetical protein VFL94_05560 [Actinomycetales bacterium]|nr:hypothetical protein [Actinomycetales bacterium]